MGNTIVVKCQMHTHVVMLFKQKRVGKNLTNYKKSKNEKTTDQYKETVEHTRLAISPLCSDSHTDFTLL